MVGLGNPGREYQGTRHNVGFAVIERLAARWGLERERKRFHGLLREGRAGDGGPRIALLEPLTYMNDAGRSVGPARGSYHLALERVLVVHDEIDLPFGEVRRAGRSQRAEVVARRARRRRLHARAGRRRTPRID